MCVCVGVCGRVCGCVGVCDVYLGLVAVCELLANGFRIANMELGRANCGSLRGGRGAGVARGIYS